MESEGRLDIVRRRIHEQRTIEEKGAIRNGAASPDQVSVKSLGLPGSVESRLSERGVSTIGGLLAAHSLTLKNYGISDSEIMLIDGSLADLGLQRLEHLPRVERRAFDDEDDLEIEENRAPKKIIDIKTETKFQWRIGVIRKHIKNNNGVPDDRVHYAAAMLHIYHGVSVSCLERVIPGIWSSAIKRAAGKIRLAAKERSLKKLRRRVLELECEASEAKYTPRETLRYLHACALQIASQSG